MNEERRSEQMEMDIPNNDKILLPGMFAQVTLQLTNDQKNFIVPQSAIAQNSQRVFVIRVVNGKAQWVDIKRGRANADSVEVYGGLTTSDKLLENASDEIKEGAAIKVSE